MDSFFYGKWKKENGKLKMEDGKKKRRVSARASSSVRMEDGRKEQVREWKMVDGRWEKKRRVSSRAS
jgi:hypothetical protein